MMITIDAAFRELHRQMDAPEYRRLMADQLAEHLATPKGQAMMAEYDRVFADPYVWIDPWEGRD